MAMTMDEWMAKYRPDGLSDKEKTNLSKMYGTTDIKEAENIASTKKTTSVRDRTTDELKKSIDSALSVNVVPENEIKALSERGEDVTDIVNKAKAAGQRNIERALRYQDLYGKDQSGLTSMVNSQISEIEGLKRVVPLEEALGGLPEYQGVDTPPNQTVYNNQDLISLLYDTRADSEMASLDYARESSLNALERERSETTQAYMGAKTQADVQSQLNAKKLSEVMMARGYDVGTQASQMLAQNVSAQGAQSQLIADEAKAMSDIGARETDTELKFAYDKLATETGLEAEKIQALIEEQRYQDEMAIREAELLGTYKGVETMQKQMFDKEMASIDQAYRAGEIDLETAKAQLEELQDPNSYYNKSIKLEYDIQALNYNLLSKEGQLNAERLKLEIERLKNPDYGLSDYEKRMNELEIEAAELELEKLKIEANNPDISVFSDYDNVAKPFYSTIENNIKTLELKPGSKEYVDMIVDYVKGLEANGVDELIIDFLLTKYNLPLGK